MMRYDTAITVVILLRVVVKLQHSLSPEKINSIKFENVLKQLNIIILREI